MRIFFFSGAVGRNDVRAVWRGNAGPRERAVDQTVTVPLAILAQSSGHGQ